MRPARTWPSAQEGSPEGQLTGAGTVEAAERTQLAGKGAGASPELGRKSPCTTAASAEERTRARIASTQLAIRPTVNFKATRHVGSKERVEQNHILENEWTNRKTFFSKNGLSNF